MRFFRIMSNTIKRELRFIPFIHVYLSFNICNCTYCVNFKTVLLNSVIQEHDADARRLIQKNPEVAPQTRQKLSEVQDNWRKLTNLCLNRYFKLVLYNS